MDPSSDILAPGNVDVKTKSIKKPKIGKSKNKNQEAIPVQKKPTKKKTIPEKKTKPKAKKEKAKTVKQKKVKEEEEKCLEEELMPVVKPELILLEKNEPERESKIQNQKDHKDKAKERDKERDKEREGKEPLSFTLRNIDMTMNDRRYNMDEFSKFDDPVPPDSKTTLIKSLHLSDLKYKPVQTILYDRKSPVNLYFIPFHDTVPRILSDSASIPCFGCHRVFTCRPLLVPLKCDSLPNNQMGFYGSDVVCSFNCMYSVLACIPSSQRHLYLQTPHLIMKLYHALFHEFPEEPILPAPDWRLRREYGGVLSDEEFQSSLQSIQFQNTHQVIFIPIQGVYEALNANNNKKVTSI